MNNLIDILGGKDPLYSNQHRPLMEKYAMVGGNAEKLKEQTGRHFSNVYEFYMYAAIIGMRKDYRLPLSDGAKSNFWQISNWKPNDMVHYLLMGLLDKCGTDFNEFEDMTHEKAIVFTTDLKVILEEYANGGFDIIQTKLRDDRYYFDNEYAFVQFLRELE